MNLNEKLSFNIENFKYLNFIPQKKENKLNMCT